MSDQEETKPGPPKFDFEAFPKDTLFYERRDRLERRFPLDGTAPPPPAPVPVVVPKLTPGGPERRAKKERRRRIDPTTFEKQYTDDELEFMNAMQQFKNRSGKSFPSHGDVLRVATSIGYRKVVFDEACEEDEVQVGTEAGVDTMQAFSVVLPAL